jgi:hypothetical protein
MPIHTTPVEFSVRDGPTLLFMDHCMTHWKDVVVCTDAHVAFMKHLVRSIFHLNHAMPLVGICFDDRTLAMLSPPSYGAFYALTRSDGGEWTASYVRADGFVPHWGMETGFWDGFAMAEDALLNGESTGPGEDR